VLGEEMYVEQVVQNLLNNAAKYSPAGSEVSVIVEPVGGEIVVRVLDEGIGLSDESPDTLFELFYRSAHAARQASGAGIGLFVCRQLIESMGGRIWARRRETAGSEFGFALPVHAEADADDEPD
jgi:signal transduction histidine kinase